MIKRKSNLDKTIRRIRKKIGIKIKKHKTKLIIILIIIFFLVGIKISYKKYIDNEKNIINTVFFDKYIINNKQLSGLVSFTEKTFSGKNSVKNKIFGYKTAKINILNKYKFLKKINVKLINTKTIKVGLYFKKPKLDFIGSGKIYGVYSQDIIKGFDIDNISGLNLLYTGVDKIYLPSYLYGKKIDNNIFFKTNFQTLIDSINKIKKVFNKGKIYYLAGGEDIIIQTKDKIYIFSLTKDITKQINKLDIIRQKIPGKLKEVKIIDLGNLDSGVYLKKNNIGK